MSDQVIHEIMKRLDTLAEKLGVATQQLLVWATRAELASAYAGLGLTLVGVMGLSIAWYLWRRSPSQSEAHDAVGVALGIATVAAIVVILVTFHDNVAILVSPEFAGFKALLRAIR